MPRYHSDSFCGCFSGCDYSRRPDAFASTAKIFEFDSPDVPPLQKFIPYLSRYESNPCLGKVCKYSDPATWGEDGVPTAMDTDIIYIPENVTLGFRELQ